MWCHPGRLLLRSSVAADPHVSGGSPGTGALGSQAVSRGVVWIEIVALQAKKLSSTVMISDSWSL